VVVLVVVAAFAGVDALSSVPSVSRDAVVTGTVRRGELVRTVRGPGQLVSERVRWIAAVTAGRIDEIRVRPGDPVTPETVVLVLRNPDVEIEALEAERQLADQEARLVDLDARLRTDALAQEAVVAGLEAPLAAARRALATEEDLAARDLSTGHAIADARDAVRGLETRLDLETRRLQVMHASGRQQIAAQEAQVARFRALSEHKAGRVRAMAVTAGATGVLAELSLEEGQWVRPGDALARVVDPDALVAEVRIPESDARDLRVGQRASIDFRSVPVRGEVVRVDPAASEGTVTVVIRPGEALPKEARPDLGVDGRVELERIPDVRCVRRPAHGRAHATVRLFRIDDDGCATPVTVELGRASVDEVEVVRGLDEGEEVILSDATRWSDHAEIRVR
jgi:multidrug resistance efflux pump